MKRKVLIIDDDVDFVNLLSARLQANDCEVAIAFDAMRAIREAQEQRPNLVILDIRLPGGNGFRVFKALRESHFTALIPIIFVTGFDRADVVDEKATRESLEKLGNPFLIKPFTAEDLLGKIEEALQNPADAIEKRREMETIREIITSLARG